jgi:hypothetical protein
MWRVFRIALTWLLALAVPVQAIAVVRMMHCGPGHHGASLAQSSVTHAHDDRQHAETSLHAPHGSGGAHVHPFAVANDSGDDASDSVTSHKLANGSCSACASCCTAAALPVRLTLFEPSAAHDVLVPHPSRGIAAFVTGGPERPPRTFLA